LLSQLLGISDYLFELEFRRVYWPGRRREPPVVHEHQSQVLAQVLRKRPLIITRAADHYRRLPGAFDDYGSSNGPAEIVPPYTGVVAWCAIACSL
jgi:hypothetical protein